MGASVTWEEAGGAGAFQPAEQKAQDNLVSVYKHWMGGCKEDGAKLFSVVHSNKIKSNGHKLEYKKFHLNVREHFLTMRVAKHWNRLATEAEVSIISHSQNRTWHGLIPCSGWPCSKPGSELPISLEWPHTCFPDICLHVSFPQRHSSETSSKLQSYLTFSSLCKALLLWLLGCWCVVATTDPSALIVPFNPSVFLHSSVILFYIPKE